jgi:DNA-3-methyladenine glycosylase I
MTIVRCSWAGDDPLMRAYHDEEWGVAEYDSRALWEKLILDGFQAGLSWSTILRKRAAFRTAFLNFDPARIAAFTKADVERLLGDRGIIRSRAKIEATIGNARAYLAIPDFSAFVWGFSGGEPIRNRWQDRSEVPAQTPLSHTISKALKQAGFKFVGPVIVYAWMQAIGMVDDHLVTCFRHVRHLR